MRTVFRLEASDEQMARVQDAALRRRELAWEAARRWNAAEAKPTPERATAEPAVEDQLSSWPGHDVDAAGGAQIIAGESRKAHNEMGSTGVIRWRDSASLSIARVRRWLTEAPRRKVG